MIRPRNRSAGMVCGRPETVLRPASEVDAQVAITVDQIPAERIAHRVRAIVILEYPFVLAVSDDVSRAGAVEREADHIVRSAARDPKRLPAVAERRRAVGAHADV